MGIAEFVIVVALLILVLKIISLPFKIIIRFVINSIIGGIILFILSYFGFGLPVTWWTVVLTGLFGIPGLVISVILAFFII